MDGLHVILVLGEADAGSRHGVSTDGLSGSVAGCRTLPHGLHQLRAGLWRDDTRHGAGEDGWRCGRLRT